MKKLNFMNVKGQELTREEMRNVMAGSGGCGGSTISCYTCNGGECAAYSGPGYGWTECTTNGWGACVMGGAACGGYSGGCGVNPPAGLH